jgi:hypothetical protein
MAERLFTSKQASEVTGIALSTLNRWEAGSVVSCTIPGAGKGTGRRWAYRDIVLVEVAHELATHAVSLDAIGRIVAAVRGHWLEDDPEAAGAILISSDGGALSLGHMPHDQTKWKILTTDYLPAGNFGELLFFLDVTKIGRRIQARIDELDKE